MTKIFKIQIHDIDDARSIASFESTVPKYFFKAGDYKVIRSETSFFDTIPFSSDWRETNTGFRDHLREMLKMFYMLHNAKIRDLLTATDRIHAVATLSLTLSISWVEGLINFIDETYDELVSARFGTKKAWHLTTRLARRIFEDIDKSCQGVAGSLTAGGNKEVCTKLFHAIIRSHNAMGIYRELNFKDHQSVSLESIKFLSTNTRIDAIEKLQIRTAALNETIKNAVKEIKGATTHVSTTSNKIDEMKRTLLALEKRLVKLEK